MGRGQAVRQWVLVLLLGGSNPSVPDYFHQKRKILLYLNLKLNEKMFFNIFNTMFFNMNSKYDSYNPLFFSDK